MVICINFFSILLFKRLLLLPMEWLELHILVFPAWFAHGVDYEWCHNHNYATYDKHHVPDGAAANRNLCRRYEAKYKCQKTAKKTHAGYNPHKRVPFASYAERAAVISHAVSQVDGCGEHQQVHYQIEQNCQLR